MKTRRYSELVGLRTFDDRFDYLELRGVVGEQTFGFDRWINQRFYTSREWKQARDVVIIRDEGCDLGIPGYEIRTELLVHHMNPISFRDLDEMADWILDPEYLITTCKRTHNALHYGNRGMLPKPVLQRQPGDTRLW
jgi:hypothetical protein